MKPKLIFLGAALLGALTLPSAQAQTSEDTTPTSSVPKSSHRFQIGPEIGVFLPTSGKTRDQFGSSWLSVGLGFGTINRVTPQGQITFDLQLLYQTRDNGHAFVAPVGVSYRKAVSQSGGNTVYVGVTGDLYLVDLRSLDCDVHSGLRTGFGGSVLTGVNLGESGYLEARYLAVSRVKGFDLSGLNLTAGYRF